MQHYGNAASLRELLGPAMADLDGRAHVDVLWRDVL